MSTRNSIILAGLVVIAFVAGGLLWQNGSDNGDPGNGAPLNGDVENVQDVENPVLTIRMESGAEIVIELFPNVAPNTVHNMIHLVQEGFYDGTIFHRVIPNFMIQGGDPTGTGGGGPGHSIRGEFTANGFENNLSHERGVVSMARAPNPDSAGSQFFIVVANSPHLDGQYAAFGRVIEGMDEADRIANVQRDRNDRPVSEERMVEVTVDTFGHEYPEPERINR